MRVLILHNRYRYAGGEDTAVEGEVRLLQKRGVEVLFHEAHNPSPDAFPLSAKVKFAVSSGWSKQSYRQVRQLCLDYRPDVAHVHNFWFSLTPSVHAASHDAGVATIQTLHNFRLLCANSLFLRQGQICEDCLGKVPWRGVARRCYHGSFVASAAVGTMMVTNRARDTWNRHVDAFLTPSEFARSKFIAGNLPADRVFVKPNVVEDFGRAPLPASASNRVVYVGRLSEEKGVSLLLSSWAASGLGSFGRLLIVGDGPAASSCRLQAQSLGLEPPSVVFAGKTSPEEVRRHIAESRAVVLPSLCYESFGLAVVEAFCAGRPAVVSGIGALADIVADGRTGLKFQPGDGPALAGALSQILRDDALADRLGDRARSEYTERYTTERNYEMLMRAYRFAIERRGTELPETLRAPEPAADRKLP